MKIAGIIHDIAHNSIKDYVLVQSIKLFSMQTSQQVMQFIHIYGILRFDRTSIYGVSENFQIGSHEHTDYDQKLSLNNCFFHKTGHPVVYWFIIPSISRIFWSSPNK